MQKSPRFVLVGLSLAATAGMAPAASAQTADTAPPGAAAAAGPYDDCPAAFDAGADSGLSMAWEPAPRSDVGPGSPIRLTGQWPVASWDSVTSMVACVRLYDTTRPELSAAETPAVNDGTFEHSFAVPEGLRAGTVLCTKLRMAGDPAGAATAAVWYGKQACFEVHPAGAPPAGSPSTPPPATPPATSPPGPPTGPAEPPATEPRPTPAGSSGPVGNAPAAPPPAAATPVPPAPAAPAAGVISPIPAPTTAPVEMPFLPKTGAGPLGLLAAGAGSLALGLAARRGARM